VRPSAVTTHASDLATPPASERLEPSLATLLPIALLGVAGSALLAFASNLAASPFGPRAAGLWPFAASGAAPSWLGPTTPKWAAPANSGHWVPSGHLLDLAAALLGVLLLMVAWLRLWRSVRADRRLGFRRIWWVPAAWTAPLLFAAPLASQDAWLYAARGKAVASGLGSSGPLHLLGRSVWLSGVDPHYRSAGSIYGPGANDLSAFFSTIAGGRPWIAVDCWRVLAIAAMVLCSWGVARVASAYGANAVEAVVAGVANPGVLIVLIGGIHNDALMIGLVVAAVALAVTDRAGIALGMVALAVTIKAPAALAGLAIAWWCWKGSWSRRILALGLGVGLALVALASTGLGSGGGFAWLRGASLGPASSSLSIVRFAGTTATGPVSLAQTAGICAAIVVVIAVPRGRNWVGALAMGFALMALFAATSQPWYLLWAVPLVACVLVDGGPQRAVIVILCAMTVWSMLPLAGLAWFAGIIALAALWVRGTWSLDGSALLGRRPTAISDRL
jgi:hypothetical protein